MKTDPLPIARVTWSHFGGSFNMERLKNAQGQYPTTIIVATLGKGGLKPIDLLLPHQLYTHTARKLLSSSDVEKIYIMPLYDSVWTEVIPPPEEEDKLRKELWELENVRMKEIYE